MAYKRSTARVSFSIASAIGLSLTISLIISLLLLANTQQPSAAAAARFVVQNPRTESKGNVGRPASSQTSGERQLQPGKPIERELAGNQAHSYQLKLTAGQYLHVVVEQRGIDVVVTLFGPDGKKLAEVDSPNGTQGPEPVSWIAETTGNYRIEVRSLEKNVPTGRYEVRIAELRAATTQDSNRVAARKSFAEGEAFYAQGTAGTLRMAIKKYEEALLQWRIVDDRREEANVLYSIGAVYDSLGENKKALDFYNQSLPLWSVVSDRGEEARTLNKIGSVHNSLGERQKALDYLNQALPLRRAVGDRDGEATTLNDIGVVYYSLGEMQKAINFYDQALLLRRAVGNRNGEAITLNNIASAYYSLGEMQKALDYFDQALPVLRTIGDRGKEAGILNNIGAIYHSLGNKQKAFDYFKQSLSMIRGAGNQGREVVALSNIGSFYDSLGEMQEALDFYNQALLLTRAVGDRSGEAKLLNRLGKVYHSLGEMQKALDLFGEALLLQRAIGDRAGDAGALNNIGAVYSSLGEKQKALDFYNQALPLVRAVNNRADEAYILNNIGAIHFSMGDKQKVLDYFDQVLLLSRTVSDHSEEANALNNIGVVHFSLGEKQKALDLHNQALPLSRTVGNRRIEANTLDNIGYVYYSLGEKQKALDFYNQALPLRRAIGDRPEEVTTLNNIARAERALDRFNESRSHIESAIKIIESLRTKVVSQELRAAYFATVHEQYEFYTDLLMQTHKQEPVKSLNTAALQVSESARARSLLESLTEARADIRQGVDPVLLTRERELQQRLNAKAEAQLKLLAASRSEAQVTAIKKEIDALTIELQHVQTQIRQTSPRYAALTQPQPLTVTETQQVLDADTLLLEYSLGNERSFLWAVTPTAINSYELPKREVIEAAAQRVYDLLTERFKEVEGETKEQKRARIAKADVQYPTAAVSLSQMLLAPVAQQLGKKRLVIVADGVLHYLPFGALPDPNNLNEKASNWQPLVVEHEMVNLPSASTLAVLRRELAGRKPAAKTLAVLADPVFTRDDERVKAGTSTLANKTAEKKAEPSLKELANEKITRKLLQKSVGGAGELQINRLKFTRQEAEQILALVPTSERMQALDFAANRALVESDKLSQYRYVHFATHGLADSERAELSTLVLSLVDEQGRPQDGFLRAHEVYNLNLPAELVVLSACETGLGKQVKGEGLVSLTRGFMYAGAARVVVSLWSVNDRATAELMTKFYRKMLVEGQRPAAALRAAQIEMWRTPQWAAPYYWAAFTLQGEWR